MNPDRSLLSDRQYERIEPFLTGKVSDPGRTGNDNRLTLEGIFFIMRAGAPWRDLPREFGNWNTVYKRFSRWKKSGVFFRIMLALGESFDLSLVAVDATICKVHQHATGARKNGRTPEESREAQAIGVSRGGLSTKLLALVDKKGQIARFIVLPGNRGEAPELFNLLGSVHLDDINELLGDKAYDSNAIRSVLGDAGIIATIPPRSNRVDPPPYDEEHYKGRHLVENLFADLKQFRGIASRYTKLVNSFEAFVNLGAWYLATKERQRGPSPYV